MASQSSWTFLTNHASVLLTIYRGSVLASTQVRVRDIAQVVGVTERTVQNILSDLEDSGYIVRRRVGNRTHYEIRHDLPLRRPQDEGVDMGMLLDTLTGRSEANAGLVVTERANSDAIQRALVALRAHLGLDVAFISQVRDGRRTFVNVDTDDTEGPIQVGGSDPLEDSYCHYVIAGEMPELLVDPSRHPVASQMPATRTLPVGTHLSVPIQRTDGTIFGTCCCFSHEVEDHVGEGELDAVRLLARLAASHLNGN